MEQNRSYRQEAASDDNTSSSNKKSTTPRYQGAAFSPVEQPRPQTEFRRTIPTSGVILERVIPLYGRDPQVQEQLDRQNAENKDGTSDKESTSSSKTSKPTAAVPQSRVSESPVAAEHEQRRVHEIIAEEAQKSKETAETDEDDVDGKQSQHQPASAALADAHTTRQEQYISYGSSVVPAEAAPAPDSETGASVVHEPLHQHPRHESTGQPEAEPFTYTQQEAFTPPQEGIPTLSIPEQGPTAPPSSNAVEHPLHHQWQSEAAPAFTGVAEQASADEPAPQAGYNQPPIPPTRPPQESSAFAQPPERPNYAYDVYESYGGGATASSGAEYQPVVYEHTVEQTHTREVQNPWIVPTMVAAVLYEGYRRRVGDRKEARARMLADKKVVEQLSTIANRRHEDVLRVQTATTEHVRELQTEQHRQAHEQQRLREVQERFGATPLTYGSERMQATPSAFERSVSTEQQPVPHLSQPEAAPGNKPVAELTAEEAMQQTQEQHERTRKVQSIWHETEVNAVTGQEVEGVVHGKGYHEERQQEIMRDRMGDATTDPVAASMGSYAVQAQGVPQYGMTHPSLPSGMTSPALPQGVPTHVDPQHQLQPGDSGTVRSNVTNPWFWLMLGLILAAFFTAALI